MTLPFYWIKNDLNQWLQHGSGDFIIFNGDVKPLGCQLRFIYEGNVYLGNVPILNQDYFLRETGGKYLTLDLAASNEESPTFKLVPKETPPDQLAYFRLISPRIGDFNRYAIFRGDNKNLVYLIYLAFYVDLGLEGDVPPPVGYFPPLQEFRLGNFNCNDFICGEPSECNTSSGDCFLPICTTCEGNCHKSCSNGGDCVYLVENGYTCYLDCSFKPCGGSCKGTCSGNEECAVTGENSNGPIYECINPCQSGRCGGQCKGTCSSGSECKENTRGEWSCVSICTTCGGFCDGPCSSGTCKVTGQSSGKPTYECVEECPGKDCGGNCYGSCPDGQTCTKGSSTYVCKDICKGKCEGICEGNCPKGQVCVEKDSLWSCVDEEVAGEAAPPKKKPITSLWWFWLIIILVILAILVGGYLFYRKKNEKAKAKKSEGNGIPNQ